MKKACEGQCHGEAGAPTSTEPAVAADGSGSSVSIFAVPKMDCPSEEHMIRMALDGQAAVKALSFDLSNRQLRILHEGPVDPLLARLAPLGLGATLQSTERAAHKEEGASLDEIEEAATQEAGVLKLLLLINGVMFLVELVAGWWAQSTGLLADGLDMFADAAVYGLALYAVGHSAQRKLRAAHTAGWLQMALAVGALIEVLRRFVLGSEPESAIMMSIAAVALLANVSCLRLISRHRESGAHMKASWIFSSNDVLANIGVIVAGALVAWTQSPYPDLVIGTVIAFVVLNGARRILALKA